MVKIGVKHINIYQISFRFQEPVDALMNVGAATEEEAVEKLTKEIEQYGTNLEVFNIQVVGTYTESEQQQQQQEEKQPDLALPDNVIVFPQHPTKQ